MKDVEKQKKPEKLKKATGAITRQRPSKLRVKLHVAQSGDDQRKLSAVQGALLSPAHAFEQIFGSSRRGNHAQYSIIGEEFQLLSQIYHDNGVEFGK